ncbi:MAG: efflux RND transporter periplasmic adaptor subunit [Hyphomicrobium sp.]|nr:efflux RND transporter periplasmic adaptor subunit [Hyphomicrobium sp.]
MTRGHWALVSVAAIAAAAGAGIFAGQRGLVTFPIGQKHAGDAAQTPPSGPVIYYRDPDGKPSYSLAPKSTSNGRAYRAVLASEDVSFDPSTSSSADIAAMSGERKIKFYRNPMGLPDTSPVPKKDSMGMDYIAVYEGEDTDDGSVKVSAGKLQRTGVETTVAGRLPIMRTLKAPGVVALDERRISVIAPRFDGYVLTTGTATSGAHIKKGEILASVFGQEVLDQAARLLIEQLQGGRNDDDGPGLTGNRVAPGGVVGATRRLRNLGIPDDFINKVKRDRRVPDTLSMIAPFDGIVLERMVVDGQAFKPGDVLFRVADHSVIWVLADVPEGDVGSVQPGQPVTVRTRAYPGRDFKGKVALVYPHLMKETRTGRVRIELENPDLALLPDMYADVDIETGSSDPVVVVPNSAVIDSGERKVVIVAEGEGRYLPRNVKTGKSGDGLVEIVEGIADGDRVVVNGNFLIDAESNLQAALKALTAPADSGAQP